MGIVFQDNFNRADGAIGSNYTAIASTGGTALSIVSNVVESSSTSGHNGGVYYNGASVADDQYSQLKLVRYTARVFVRVTNTGGEYNGYFFEVSTIFNTINIYRYTNNVGQVSLASGTNSTVANDVVYLEIQGSSLVAKINGTTVLTATDSNFASGQPGFYIADSGGDRIDDFEVGDFSSAALTAGTATFDSSGPSGISISSTAATGGTSPYSYQWKRNANGGSFSNLSNGGGVTGATTLSLVDGSATGGTLYGYKCDQTDSAGSPATVTTNTVTAQIYSGGALSGGGLMFVGGMTAGLQKSN